MGSILTQDQNITVLDDFLTEEEANKLAESAKLNIWQFGWPKKRKFNERTCWHIFIAGKNRPNLASCENELIENQSWSFLKAIWDRAKSAYIKNHTLIGVYANGQIFPQESSIHRDCPPNQSGMTLLLFGNEYWSTMWGGELVFYSNSKDEIIKSVLPKSKRAVIFDARIPHSAKSPSIECREMRVSIAFKSVKQKETDHA